MSIFVFFFSDPVQATPARLYLLYQYLGALRFVMLRLWRTHNFWITKSNQMILFGWDTAKEGVPKNPHGSNAATQLFWLLKCSWVKREVMILVTELGLNVDMYETSGLSYYGTRPFARRSFSRGILYIFPRMRCFESSLPFAKERSSFSSFLIPGASRHGDSPESLIRTRHYRKHQEKADRGKVNTHIFTRHTK